MARTTLFYRKRVTSDGYIIEEPWVQATTLFGGASAPLHKVGIDCYDERRLREGKPADIPYFKIEEAMEREFKTDFKPVEIEEPLSEITKNSMEALRRAFSD